ncbi:MAG: hypothetical protein ACYC1D_12735 [Acidimicrobiales bacterium]
MVVVVADGSGEEGEEEVLSVLGVLDDVSVPGVVISTTGRSGETVWG